MEIIINLMIVRKFLRLNSRIYCISMLLISLFKDTDTKTNIESLIFGLEFSWLRFSGNFFIRVINSLFNPDMKVLFSPDFDSKKNFSVESLKTD